MTYFTYQAIAPNYKQQILSPAKPEVYVKSVYFNLFGWRWREVH
jgi:hypothetical protein